MGKNCKNVWAAVCSRPSVRHVFRATDFYGTPHFLNDIWCTRVAQNFTHSVEKHGEYRRKFIYILK